MKQNSLEQYCERAFTLPFADYITFTQKHLKTVREQAKFPHDDLIIKMNSPFERRPENYNGKRAVLLIHGFLASPYIMRSIGELYVRQGFLVRAILLPGHGSIPGELLTVQLQEWQQAVQYGIDSLKREAAEIHLAGYSLGATLACLAAEKEPIKSLSLFAPAFGITRLAKVLPTVALCNRSRLSPLSRWVFKQPEQDHGMYHSITIQGAAQVYAAIWAANRLLTKKALSMPWFVVASVDDSTVKIAPIVHYFKQQNHPQSWLRLYARELKVYQGQKIEVIASHCPEHRIIDMSHIGIPVSPLDPYYGSLGVYLQQAPKDSYFGEFSRRNIRRYQPFFRLTYNPDFGKMAVRFEQFLQAI